MKFDIENIIVLGTIMKSLSMGVDPTSNTPFPNDTLLNSNLLKNCFKETAEILGFIEKNIDAMNDLPHKKVTNQKEPFFIMDHEIKSVPLSDAPITVSKFVFAINEVCKRSEMKKLRATQITSWLMTQGYLEEIASSDGVLCKSATKHGRELGITSVKKTNSRDEEYIINLYNKSAQEFILQQVIPNLAK